MFLKFTQVELDLKGIYTGGKGGGEAYIQDVNWVSYLGGLYSESLYTGHVLTGFYGILKFPLFLCNKRPVFYHVNSICFETIT